MMMTMSIRQVVFFSAGRCLFDERLTQRETILRPLNIAVGRSDDARNGHVRADGRRDVVRFNLIELALTGA